MAHNGTQHLQYGFGPLKSGQTNDPMGQAPYGNPMMSVNLADWQMPNLKSSYMSPAQIKQEEFKMGQVTPYASRSPMAPSSMGQTTDIGFFGEGGYADTGLSAFKALGGMYLGNEQRKLAASDLDFRRDSFERQYGNQVATVNDQLYDRQRNRNLRSGMDNDAAGMAADDYVRNRGVGQERRTVR
jgi:hypothetical protein